ncbi:universal stress protein [Shumkonia mesophila]|uniref:universal stress protein n=1 Tax=Shumkonia mesophila TaxID=2838854 RepID=UPI0029350603|nr:universal stress protein [Shumkonia mesophila]
MPIKTILVPLDGTEGAQLVLDAACAVAQHLAAHIEVLHVRADSKNAVPLLGEGMSGAMIEEMIDLAEKEAMSRAQKARAMFEEACQRLSLPVVDNPPGPNGPSAAWVDETGREDEVTAKRGRLADLIVVARPTPDSDVTFRMTLNAAIRETGRPVLVIPPGGAKVAGHKVAIAWNGSHESSRAVRLAMTFVESAEEVFILTAEGGGTRACAASQLARYLSWHGIAAKTRTFEIADRAGGEDLLKECKEVGADLLIMGAYTQSRVRTLILGGVTSHVLGHADLPVVMAR